MGLVRVARGVILADAIRLKNGVLLFDSPSVPVNGTKANGGTMADVAGPGSRCYVTNGDVFVNTGTKASPVWTHQPSGSVSPSASTSPSSSKSPSSSPSASQSPSASVSPSPSPS